MPRHEGLDKGETERGDGTEDRIAQRGTETGEIARHGANRDRPANAERRRRSYRQGDDEADDRPLDHQRDRVEDEVGNVHAP